TVGSHRRLPRAAPRDAARASGSSVRDGIEPPLARNALQLGRPAILERNPRAGDEVLHRLRDEHLAGRHLRGHPRADRDSDPRDARSPSSAARAVEPTMSVKSTVASTLSTPAGSTRSRAAHCDSVNAWTSRANASAAVNNGM